MDRARVALLIGLLLAVSAPDVAAQVGKRDRDKPEIGDVRNPNQEFGVGRLKLGASARGRVVQGFYNMISFEAVAGTRIDLELKTRHKSAQLIADLLPPGRHGGIELVGLEEDPRTLVLKGHELTESGMHTVRFGYKTEHNGDYTLKTSGQYPVHFETTLDLVKKDRDSLILPGMEGRKIKLMLIELPADLAADMEILDPYGTPLKLKGKVRTIDWGERRIEVTDLPIESNEGHEVRLLRTAGTPARLRVQVEFDNPPLSKRTRKI